MKQCQEHFTEEELENMNDIDYYKYKSALALSHFRDWKGYRITAQNKELTNEHLISLVDGLGAIEDPAIIPSDEVRSIISNVKIALEMIRKNLYYGEINNEF